VSLSSLLVNLVTIQRKTSTIDAAAGESVSWTSDLTPLPASVQPISAREAMLYAQRNVRVSHHIFFDQDPQVTLRDRIQDNASGKLYRIVNLFDMAGRGVAWRVEVLEWGL
jgi:hypothetical protein